MAMAGPDYRLQYFPRGARLKAGPISSGHGGQSAQEASEDAPQVSDQQREQKKIDQQTEQHAPRAMMA